MIFRCSTSNISLVLALGQLVSLHNRLRVQEHRRTHAQALHIVFMAVEKFEACGTHVVLVGGPRRIWTHEARVNTIFSLICSK